MVFKFKKQSQSSTESFVNQVYSSVTKTQALASEARQIEHILRDYDQDKTVLVDILNDSRHTQLSFKMDSELREFLNNRLNKLEEQLHDQIVESDYR